MSKVAGTALAVVPSKTSNQAAKSQIQTLESNMQDNCSKKPVYALASYTLNSCRHKLFKPDLQGHPAMPQGIFCGHPPRGSIGSRALASSAQWRGYSGQLVFTRNVLCTNPYHVRPQFDCENLGPKLGWPRVSCACPARAHPRASKRRPATKHGCIRLRRLLNGDISCRGRRRWVQTFPCRGSWQGGTCRPSNCQPYSQHGFQNPCSLQDFSMSVAIRASSCSEARPATNKHRQVSR